MKTYDTASTFDILLNRPALFWGDSTDHLHSFGAFLSGVWFYNDPMFTAEAREAVTNFIPRNFNEFLYEEFGLEFPGGHGWQSIIKERTKTDHEAMSLLFELRKKYDQSKWAKAAKDS
ncbi:MAG: hypothetical protein ACO1TE_03130 [Prosthecobacter sp.]